MSATKLAIFTPCLGTSSETFIQKHITDLCPANVVVIADDECPDEGPEWAKNIPVLILNKLPSVSFRYRVMRFLNRRAGKKVESNISLVVKDYLRSENVKVILSQYLHSSIPWISVANDLGIPVYAHAHGLDVSKLLKINHWKTEYLKLNSAQGIITMSNISKKRLIDAGLQENIIHVIPYGVDIPKKSANKKSGETIKCLAVGRMVGKKAPIYTLDAFRMALDSRPNMQLDYVGDGELLTSAHHFVKVSGIAEKVVFHGSQPNSFVQNLMMNADIFVQHSVVDPVTGDEEGLPVAILEAMSNGLPVITTYHSGIPEAVINGQTGYMVNEGDTRRMADRIIELADDVRLRRDFGDKGKKRISEHFSWEKEKNKLSTLLGLNVLS